MVVAKIFSGAPVGFEGRLIEVEGDTTRGLPSMQIVGLANKSIDEAKERIKSALSNSLLEYPAKRITINLAPAELPKEGTHYDLPMALAILVSSGQLQQNEVAHSLFAGELALDGSIRPIRGAISLSETARDANIKYIFLPEKNVQQAQMVSGVTVIGVSSLKQLFLHLKGEAPLKAAAKVAQVEAIEHTTPTLDDIYGQDQAKRALIIAAAGRHNILLTGSPGTGKTMLAKALTGLLPPPTDNERIAITKMHSLAGEDLDIIPTNRPFRSPHHTSSRVSLIGGGARPQPGEISLAHLGVLFLDEMPEYSRATLEALRQPIEDKTVSISRANSRVSYPADFMLVATMNPCPCGYYGDQSKECSCSLTQILAYQRRLSGPLLDRIDITVTVPRVAHDTLAQHSSMTKEQHTTAVKTIRSAVAAQYSRYNGSHKYNDNLTSTEIRQHIPLSTDVRNLLSAATDRLQLSTRAYFRVIRVARTIADLEECDDILAHHVGEALQYRQSS